MQHLFLGNSLRVSYSPVFLPREPRGQRSLMSCCPWGCTESDMTEAPWQASKQARYSQYQGLLQYLQQPSKGWSLDLQKKALSALSFKVSLLAR